MSGKVFDFARGLPWIKSLAATNDDEHADRVNHRYTVGFLLVCACLAFGTPFVTNRISCWTPAQFTSGYQAYTNNYCWVSNTYYVPNNVSVPNSITDRSRAEIGYYQWAPFIFMVFALFFYLPRMLWRSMNTRSGIDIQFLLSIRKEADKEKDKHKAAIAAIDYYCQPDSHKTSFATRLCRMLWCTSGKRLGNYLRSLYLIVKLLYLINSFAQLILIHIVLGQPGWFYGFDIWRSVFIQNSVLTDSPYFPRITLCDLRIREVGNLHRYTVQCVLPINMLNEKLFSLAWFWFAYVFISNLISFISTLYETLNANSRIRFIKDLYNKSGSKIIVNDSTFQIFTQNYLMQDGVLILEIIYRNGPILLAEDIVKGLMIRYLNKTAPQFENSDV